MIREIFVCIISCVDRTGQGRKRSGVASTDEPQGTRLQRCVSEGNESWTVLRIVWHSSTRDAAAPSDVQLACYVLK